MIYIIGMMYLYVFKLIRDQNKDLLYHLSVNAMQNVWIDKVRDRNRTRSLSIC